MKIQYKIEFEYSFIAIIIMCTVYEYPDDKLQVTSNSNK